MLLITLLLFFCAFYTWLLRIPFLAFFSSSFSPAPSFFFFFSSSFVSSPAPTLALLRSRFSSLILPRYFFFPHPCSFYNTIITLSFMLFLFFLLRLLDCLFVCLFLFSFLFFSSSCLIVYLSLCLSVCQFLLVSLLFLFNHLFICPSVDFSTLSLSPPTFLFDVTSGFAFASGFALGLIGWFACIAAMKELFF